MSQDLPTASNGTPDIPEIGQTLQVPALTNETLSRLQSFTIQLNRKPPKVKVEQLDGKDIQHVPISIIENLLRRLYFGLYTIEIIDYKLIVNEVCVHARIKVFHPIIREWLTYDGVGSVPVQQRSGSKVNEFIDTKIVNALHKNLPAAYAFAVKNAAKKIGKCFGADLMRKDEDDYHPYNIKPEKLND